MKTSETIDEAILRSIRASRSASVFSAKQFDRVGNPAAVRQALSRLAKTGKLRRIRQGLREMFFEEPPAWAVMVERLRRLEYEINAKTNLAVTKGAQTPP